MGELGVELGLRVACCERGSVCCCSYFNFLLRPANSSEPSFRTTPRSIAHADRHNEHRQIRLRPCFPKALKLGSSGQGKEQNRHCKLLGARCGSAATGQFHVGLGLQAIAAPTSFKITQHVGSLTCIMRAEQKESQE